MRRDERLIASLAELAPDKVALHRRRLVVALQERGWTYQRIAEAVGVTKSAVSNWMNR